MKNNGQKQILTITRTEKKMKQANTILAENQAT